MVSPFNFKKLPQLTRDEVQWLNLLHHPQTGSLFSGELQGSIEELLSKELGLAVHLKADRMTTEGWNSLLPKLPQTGVTLVFGAGTAMGLSPIMGFCEVDLLLAHSIVDRLLGGNGEPLTTLRPLTEIEQGVFSYLVLRLLSLFSEKGDLHLRLHDFCSSPKEFSPLIRGDEKIVVVPFQFKIGNQSCYFRLLFPFSFVQALLKQPADQEEGYYQHRLKSLGFVRTQLVLEAGRSSIKPSELNGLKEGDVVLLEGTEPHHGTDPTHVTLRLGEKGGVAIGGKIISKEGKLRVQVEGTYLEQPV